MIIYLQMIESDEDKSKFEQLYIMYKGLMFHVAMKILKNEFDAEDAVHQAFLSLIGRVPMASKSHCLVIMVWPMLWHDYRLPIVISYCCAIIMDTLYEKYHLCCI